MVLNILRFPNELLLMFLSYLDSFELLFVNDVCQRFRGMAQLDLRVLSTETRPVTIKIANNAYDFNYIEDWDCVYVSYISSILKYLRVFGNSIRVLTVDGIDATEDQIYTVFTYINRYCPNVEVLTLKEIHYSVGRSLKKPFKNVQDLTISHCDVKGRLYDIEKWFPLHKDLCLERVTFDRVPTGLMKFGIKPNQVYPVREDIENVNHGF